MELTEGFWDNRYRNEETGWDLNQVSPPLAAYIDQITDKKLNILIPGAGRAHEANYLISKGFKHVTVLDISTQAIAQAKKLYPKLDKHLVHEDFFEHYSLYDLILEQTFFCALDPTLRVSYVKKMHQLLKPTGKLVGLLFNREFEKQGPPFGGSREEYEKLFKPNFTKLSLEDCYNSIGPRMDSELFLIAQRADK